jgi:hypothetical protein
VKLESFALERSGPNDGGVVKGKGPAVNGQEAGVAFLTVENLILVGWNHRLLAMFGAEDCAADRDDELLISKPGGSTGQEIEAAHVLAQPTTRTSTPDADFLAEVAAAEDGDDFEVMDVPQQRMSQRRAEAAARTSLSSDYSVAVNPEQLPWSSLDPTKPLKLTPLRAIPNLPYKQNWLTNVLAVIASVSNVQPSTIPPFSQRMARLAHPSTSKQVHLTVFLDAPEFTPQVGSVVLLLGVKNHRFDGGSLKKYASDKPKNGGRWWFDDPVQFTWCDVEGLKTWWRQRQLE